MRFLRKPEILQFINGEWVTLITLPEEEFFSSDIAAHSRAIMYNLVSGDRALLVNNETGESAIIFLDVAAGPIRLVWKPVPRPCSY